MGYNSICNWIRGPSFTKKSQVSNLKRKEMSSTNNRKSRLASTVFRFSFASLDKVSSSLDKVSWKWTRAHPLDTGTGPIGGGPAGGGRDGGPAGGGRDGGPAGGGRDGGPDGGGRDGGGGSIVALMAARMS